MIHRGNAARLPAVALLCAVLLAGSLLVFHMSAMADSARHCARFANASATRAAEDTGAGAPVVVIGDSYSVGLGLDRPARSWPAELDGRVHVAGFSGSGFSEGASGCGEVAFADRAADAVDGQPGAGRRRGWPQRLRPVLGRHHGRVRPADAGAGGPAGRGGRSGARPGAVRTRCHGSTGCSPGSPRSTGRRTSAPPGWTSTTSTTGCTSPRPGHRDLGRYVADQVAALG